MQARCERELTRWHFGAALPWHGKGRSPGAACYDLAAGAFRNMELDCSVLPANILVPLMITTPRIGQCE